MLVKMTPEQVSTFWDDIGPCIEQALPPATDAPEARLNKILESLLLGVAECWASYEVADRFILHGVVITTVRTDELLGYKTLLIYAVYGSGVSTRKHWEEGYECLRKYAKGMGCTSMTAFSKVPQICKMVKALGGDTSYRYIVLPIANTEVSYESL